MHKYTVELRIHGEQLVPSEVSVDLGLEPSLARQAGDERSQETNWQEGLWAFDGVATGQDPMWDSLEDALNFVLDMLVPVRGKLKNYQSKYKLVWWCAHFQSSFDGGPLLSSSLLKRKRLGDFGVELYIDNYFSSDEEPESK